MADVDEAVAIGVALADQVVEEALELGQDALDEVERLLAAVAPKYVQDRAGVTGGLMIPDVSGAAGA